MSDLVKPPSFPASEQEEKEATNESMDTNNMANTPEIQCSPDQYIKANKLKSSAEQVLFIAWKESDEKRKELERSNAELLQKMQDLEKRFLNIEKKIHSPQPTENYSTNEEELAKETEWIRTRTK
ncbi:uncharacterized protein LOC120349185, partial [Nilaparvata lugens]|uniref:uncharacterized protein LOC120349185 n=1 Tax=Nilaparvata lugens TaxID=108931 RepID=UPI00193E78FB